MLKILGSIIGGLVCACLMFMIWNRSSLKEAFTDIKKNFWLWIITVIFMSFLLWLVLLEAGVWGI